MSNGNNSGGNKGSPMGLLSYVALVCLLVGIIIGWLIFGAALALGWNLGNLLF